MVIIFIYANMIKGSLLFLPFLSKHQNQIRSQIAECVLDTYEMSKLDLNISRELDDMFDMQYWNVLLSCKHFIPFFYFFFPFFFSEEAALLKFMAPIFGM